VGTVFLVIIGGGIAILLLLAVFVWKGAYLDALPELAGERTVFEETDLTVRQRGNRPTNFIWCTVRVTNKRIIVAQKPLLGKRRSLRHVIDYGGGEGTSLGDTMKRGYIVASVGKDDIDLSGLDGDEPVVRIPLGGGALTSGQTVEIPTKRADDYRAALG
jgi:hypothetical protein